MRRAVQTRTKRAACSATKNAKPECARPGERAPQGRPEVWRELYSVEVSRDAVQEAVSVQTRTFFSSKKKVRSKARASPRKNLSRRDQQVRSPGCVATFSSRFQAKICTVDITSLTKGHTATYCHLLPLMAGASKN